MNERTTDNLPIVADVSDPEIYDLCDRTHVPAEMRNISGDLVSVNCVACGQVWPCATKIAVRSTQVPGMLVTHGVNYVCTEMVSIPADDWDNIVCTIGFLESVLPKLRVELSNIKRELRVSITRTIDAMHHNVNS